MGELKLLSDKENDLMHLLNEYNAKNIDDKALRLKIKQIAKSFNAQRKEMQKMNKLKRKKQKKVRKKEKKMKRRQKNKNGDDDEKEETDDEFVEIDAETFEDSVDGSSTTYSEGDDETKDVEPGTDELDEFDCLFEGF